MSFNYTTVDRDRLDILAQRFYGNMQGISILADANPFVPLDAIFPAGTVLIVPIVNESQVIKNENLPPWKQ